MRTSLVKLGSEHKTVNSLIDFFTGSLTDVYKKYSQGIYDVRILEELLIYDRDLVPEKYIQDALKEKDPAAALKANRRIYIIEQGRQEVNIEFHGLQDQLLSMELENEKLRKALEELNMDNAVHLPTVLLPDEEVATPNAASSETIHTEEDNDEPGPNLAGNDSGAASTIIKKNFFDLKRHQRKMKKAMKEIERLINGNIMAKGVFDYRQIDFLLDCISGDVPLEIIRQIAKPEYSINIMEQIVEVKAFCAEDAQRESFIDSLIANDSFSEDQLEYLIDCIYEGEEVFVIRQLANSAYPVDMMKNLRRMKAGKVIDQNGV